MTYLKIKEDGTMEVQLDTDKDRKLQYDNLMFRYFARSNFIDIVLDTTPVTFLVDCIVIKKGEPVRFKCKLEDNKIQIFNLKNMELDNVYR